MDQKWNLKKQAESASKNVDEWPEWMKETGYFSGSEGGVSRNSDSYDKNVITEPQEQPDE